MALKQDILSILELNKGIAVSGQQLAEQLGVTRNSIWKAIKALQSQGHNIVATTNKGYMLDKMSDILTSESIRACLDDKFKDIDIIALQTTTSTNAEAMKMLQDRQLTHGTLIVSDEQTQGRGRMGKSFFSPKSGIYMSICLCKNIENMSDVMIITPAAALAVRRAIVELVGYDPKIKWVNDVYLGKKKVCGILTQADIDFESGKAGTFIVGIGINFAHQNFPDDIKDRAVALFENTPTVTRSELIARVYKHMLELSEDLSDHSFMQEYKQNSLVVAKQITYTINNKLMVGTVIDIDQNGGLVIDEQGKQRVLTCGEISIKSNSGDWI